MRLLLSVAAGVQQFFQIGGICYALLSLIAAVFWPPLLNYAVVFVAFVHGLQFLITLANSQIYSKWKMSESSRGLFLFSLLLSTATFYGMLWCFHQYLRPLDIASWRIVIGGFILSFMLSKIFVTRINHSYAKRMFDYRCRATLEFITMIQQSELEESIKANECIIALNTFKASALPLLGKGLAAFRGGIAFASALAEIGGGAIRNKEAIRENPEKALGIAREFVRNMQLVIKQGY